jgi:hypothetical protein
LLDFNGGTSCVQVYVNQHDFFLNRVRKDMESDDTVLSVFYDNVAMVKCSYILRWRSLADPDTIPPKNESSLTELLVEIRATVGQEAQIVQAVFPNPSFVMQVFLQRVFAQSVITRKSSPSRNAKIVLRFSNTWNSSSTAPATCQI